MKITPAKGHILVQIVKEDFEQRGKLLIPRYADKGSMFYNRTRVLEIGEPESTATAESIEWLKVGDIVIISRHGFEMGVPGQVKNAAGEFIDVMLLPRHCAIAKIEGDFAEDIEVNTLPVNFGQKIDILKVH